MNRARSRRPVCGCARSAQAFWAARMSLRLIFRFATRFFCSALSELSRPTSHGASTRAVSRAITPGVTCSVPGHSIANSVSKFQPREPLVKMGAYEVHTRFISVHGRDRVCSQPTSLPRKIDNAHASTCISRGRGIQPRATRTAPTHSLPSTYPGLCAADRPSRLWRTGCAQEY